LLPLASLTAAYYALTHLGFAAPYLLALPRSIRAQLARLLKQLHASAGAEITRPAG
jgi:hypothetical protein